MSVKWCFLLLCLCIFGSFAIVSAQDIPAAAGTDMLIPTEPAVIEKPSRGNDSEILCVPGIYQVDPDVCNPMGASEYLTDLADQGIHIPELPFSGKRLDPELSNVPYQYAKINIA